MTRTLRSSARLATLLPPPQHRPKRGRDVLTLLLSSEGHELLADLLLPQLLTHPESLGCLRMACRRLCAFVAAQGALGFDRWRRASARRDAERERQAARAYRQAMRVRVARALEMWSEAMCAAYRGRQLLLFGSVHREAAAFRCWRERYGEGEFVFPGPPSSRYSGLLPTLQLEGMRDGLVRTIFRHLSLSESLAAWLTLS